MKRSTDRILTTHGGALEQPESLRAGLRARLEGQDVDEDAFLAQLRAFVADVVKSQVDCGLDVVNDGEFGKQNFYRYVAGRVSGFELVDVPAEKAPAPWSSIERDANDFTTYYELRGRTLFGRGAGIDTQEITCTGPLAYVGQDAIRTEIENLKAALEGASYQEAFLPAPGPGTICRTTTNCYYPSDEAYLFALADALHEEYKAVTDAGFTLQVDDPHMAMSWQAYPAMSVTDYRAFTELRVEALNHALAGISPESVRLHTCWGSWVGPHTGDVELRDIVDVLLKAHANGLSLEAGNPRHEHEWHVWETVKLPDEKVLIPGVLSHVSDFVEHPQLVADRLIRYARLVGRERVIAGTDCGLRRVGHPTIAWAKFQAMAEGARLASQALWS